MEVAPPNDAGKGVGWNWATERVVVPSKPGNAGGGKDPYF